MAFTDHCSIFASLHESGVNKVVRQIIRQRPALFNYASVDIIQLYQTRPDILCAPLPEGIPRGTPLFTEIPPLPIPGSIYGTGLLLQMSALELDVHPGNAFDLPAELNPPLGAQSFSLRLRFCVGIGCSDKERLLSLTPQSDRPAAMPVRLNGDGVPYIAFPPSPRLPLPTMELNCFCVEAFAVGRVTRQLASGPPTLTLLLTGLELVDLQPAGLEQGIECYLWKILQLSILPKLHFPVENVLFKLPQNLGHVSVGLTPLSATVPANPALQNDQLEVFVDITSVP